MINYSIGRSIMFNAHPDSEFIQDAPCYVDLESETVSNDSSMGPKIGYMSKDHGTMYEVIISQEETND